MYLSHEHDSDDARPKKVANILTTREECGFGGQKKKMEETMIMKSNKELDGKKVGRTKENADNRMKKMKSSYLLSIMQRMRTNKLGITLRNYRLKPTRWGIRHFLWIR